MFEVRAQETKLVIGTGVVARDRSKFKRARLQLVVCRNCVNVANCFETNDVLKWKTVRQPTRRSAKKTEATPNLMNKKNGVQNDMEVGAQNNRMDNIADLLIGARSAIRARRLKIRWRFILSHSKFEITDLLPDRESGDCSTTSASQNSTSIIAVGTSLSVSPILNDLVCWTTGGAPLV